MKRDSQSLSDALAEVEALRDVGQVSDALARCREIARDYPDAPEPRFKEGVALELLKDPTAAQTAYRQALALSHGRHAKAASNLGVLLQADKKLAEAEALFRQALADDPDNADAHQNLARLCFDAKRYPEALYLLRRALMVRPESAQLQYSLGTVLAHLQRPIEAERALRRALELDPRLGGAWLRLGNVLNFSGRHDQAQAAYQRAIEINPEDWGAWRALMFFTNVRSVPKEEAFALHRKFDETVRCPPAGLPRRTGVPLAEGARLRVGLVSGDLRRHSVGYFVEGLLKNIDRQDFEVTAYFTAPTGDERTALLRQYTECWRNVHDWSNERLAAMIRADRIDVLVDLSGHTSHNRLGVFAMRVAPVQVTWIGYPNTTGLEQMDYRITDAIADPPGLTEELHTETLWRLPRPFLAYTPAPDAPEVAPPPVLKRGHITFGSFNSRAKIDVETIDLWSGVLHAVPGSRLLIKSPFGLNEEPARQFLRQQFTERGVEPERLDIRSGEAGYLDHLAAYADVDIGLDPYPYNGTTTTCEALWMGVPVITLAGDRHVARVGASLLDAAGLADLVADSPTEFADLATRLAADTDRLRALRLGQECSLRERMRKSPLTDSADMARQISKAWREMWERSESPPIRQEERDLTVEIADGIRVCVAASPASISTWALLEREDWFEDEIRFLRKICIPGWQVLDVGANHGIYSLALAARGARHVWAFEPMAEPRSRFLKSIAMNDFGETITVLPIGLSDRDGEALFGTSGTGNSELAHQLAVGENAPSKQRIQLDRLDSQFARTIPADAHIDFVKLDAEGMEAQVIRGGSTFFDQQSPLVMFEFRHLQGTNGDLVDLFRGMGYTPYRLVPGLGVLAPLPSDCEEAPDPFQLNLFACKADCAAMLAKKGHLIGQLPQEDIQITPRRESLDLLLREAELPAEVADAWRTFGFDTPYGRALLAWTGSRDVELPPVERLQFLYQCILELGGDAIDSHPAKAILTVRALLDLGERDQAFTVARSLYPRMPASWRFPIDRPVPAPCPDIGAQRQGEPYDAFIHRTFKEFLVLRRGHIAMFAGDAWSQISELVQSPFVSSELVRSAILDSARHRHKFTLPRSAPVFKRSPENLNGHLWHEIAIGWGIIDPDAPDEPMRLHIGGIEQNNEWKLVNISGGPGVDYALDVRDLSSIPSGSCREIYASHVLEHVGRREFSGVVADLHRLLITGGRLIVSVPDLDVLCRLFLKPGLNSSERFSIMRMMFGGQVDSFDFHLIGLAYDFMFDYLSKAGFATVRRVDDLGLFNDMSNLEMGGQKISLNLIATK